MGVLSCFFVDLLVILGLGQILDVLFMKKIVHGQHGSRGFAVGLPVLFDQLEMRTQTICAWSEFKTLPEELFEVGGCGFGCVLMDTGVFLDVQAKHGNMFAPMGNNGEDLAFCMRARDCGYKIYCDPSIVCGHVGYSVVDDQFYRLYHKE